MSGYSPFIIRAHLEQGVSMDTRIGIGLDSLLASTIRTRQKQALSISGKELDGGALHTNHIARTELPLALCQISGDDNWHWNTTTARLFDATGNHIPLTATPEIHEMKRSPEQHRFEHRTRPPLPRVISTKSGRWKAWKIPTPIIPAAYVEWAAIGSLSSVASILEAIPSIGHRRRAGEGRVLYWETIPIDQGSGTSIGHTHPDGSLGRPLLQPCLSHYGIDNSEAHFGLIGMRPPYWHMTNQYDAWY